ncbi:MAG: hypothetical protein KAI64_05625 [Thermoplasmata archaeon]|nr:hypothetical protein [Thermoplasmata archaeon]
MKGDLRTNLISAAKPTFWSLMGALVVTYFYISIFLSEFSPLPLRDASTMFFGPLFCGIILGIVLKDSEMPTLTYSTVLMTFFTLLFIFLLVILPYLLGIPVLSYILVSMGLLGFLTYSSIFILPMSLIGVIIGKALGETLFLTQTEREDLRHLKEETKKWHEELGKEEF